eukprot:scaffold133893_cov18-Tisochrysis_lutea.AAC.1
MQLSLTSTEQRVLHQRPQRSSRTCSRKPRACAYRALGRSYEGGQGAFPKQSNAGQGRPEAKRWVSIFIGCSFQEALPRKDLDDEAGIPWRSADCRSSRALVHA